MKKNVEHSPFVSRFLPTVRGWLVLLGGWLILGGFASAQTWNLSWSDEFNGAAHSPIDSTKWQFDTGILNVNDEAEYYCAPGSSTSPCDPNNSNAYIDGNGNLVIQALRINSGTAPYSASWTSARLNTANNLASFTYGRIESSMQLPIGPGLWPAFWALGTDINTTPWPACGETDYMENVPASSGLGPGVIKSTIHGPGYSGANGLGQTYSLPNGEQVTDFHTYGTIWSPNIVQFYVDDPSNIFFIRTASDIPSGDAWPFNQSFFLLLNLAVGGTGSWPGAPDSTTPSPAVMRVDYVRAYTASPITKPTMSGTPITVTAGATTGNSSTLTPGLAADSGYVYFSCSTNAPKASCAIKTSDPLNPYVANSSSSISPAETVTVSVTTTANSGSSSTTTAGLMSPPFDSKTRTWLPVTMMGFFVSVVLAPVPQRRRRKLLYACALIVGLIFTGAATWSCGGSSSNSGGGGGCTTNCSQSGNGTTPGSYTVTVYAFTESNTGNGSTSTADANVSIPLTVN
jgi:beta-glucanase (GH16 family)